MDVDRHGWIWSGVKSEDMRTIVVGVILGDTESSLVNCHVNERAQNDRVRSSVIRLLQEDDQRWIIK